MGREREGWRRRGRLRLGFCRGRCWRPIWCRWDGRGEGRAVVAVTVKVAVKMRWSGGDGAGAGAGG